MLKVKDTNKSTAKISKLVTDKSNITTTFKYEVALDLHI